MSFEGRGYIPALNLETHANTLEEEKNKFARFQDLALEFLEKQNLLEGLVEQKDGFIVVDVEKIQKIGVSFVRKGRQRGYGEEKGIDNVLHKGSEAGRIHKELLNNFKEFHHDNHVDFLFNAFYGKKVITRQQWEVYKEGKGGVQPPEAKPLFYSPDSEEAAFDPQKIKLSDFHLCLWQLFKRDNSAPKLYSLPTQDASMDEVNLACFLYHGKYGDAQRDNTGRLMVKNMEGKRQTISQDWFRRTDRPSESEKGNLADIYRGSPKLALEEGKFPHLVEGGLLTPEDFKAKKASIYTERFGVKKLITSEKGYVMIDSVRYNCGTEFGGGDYSVYKISDDLAGLVHRSDDEGEKLTHVFDLKNQQDFGGRKADSFVVKQKDVGLRSYDEQQEQVYFAKRLHEDDDVYQKRVDMFDFENFLKLKHDFAKETGVSLENLSPREQQTFLSYYKRTHENGIHDLQEFAKIYGRNGLRTFLALEYDTDAGEKIFAIQDKMDIPGAAIIFEKYNALIDQAGRVDDELEHFFTVPGKAQEVDRPLITEEILKRAGTLLAAYANGDARVKGKSALGNLVQNLEKIDGDMQLFASIFKVIYKGHDKVDFAEVNGLDFESSDTSELDPVEVGEMRRIFGENRARYGKDFVETRLQTEFDPVMKESGHHMYLLKKDGVLLSFVRFDRLPNGNMYAGFLNTRSDMQGNAIGSAFFDETLHREGGILPVEIKVRTENQNALNLYQRRLGFKIQGEPYQDAKTGKEYLRMVRPPDVQNDLAA